MSVAFRKFLKKFSNGACPRKKLLRFKGQFVIILIGIK